MSKFWSRTTKRLTPYTPGEQPTECGVIKLNTNENPYPPSPKAIQAMKEAINPNLRKYPSPSVDSLRQVIAEREGVEARQVFLGNGSDEVLSFAFQAFFERNEAIKIPNLTYSFYTVFADLYHIPYQLVSFKKDFAINIEKMYDSIGGVVFPNPNAPTGLALSREKVEKIVASNTNQVVIVDEAYVEFGAEASVPLIQKYPNLLITRTLSKSHALAGMRLGYALGHEELIEGLNRIKFSFNPYTINRVTLAGAEAALQDDIYYKTVINQIINTRKWTIVELTKLGFEVIPSKANFLLVKPNGISAKALYELLKQNKIYVRYYEQLNEMIRISIGSDYEMEQLIEVIKKIRFNI